MATLASAAATAAARAATTSTLKRSLRTSTTSNIGLLAASFSSSSSPVSLARVLETGAVSTTSVRHRPCHGQHYRYQYISFQRHFSNHNNATAGRIALIQPQSQTKQQHRNMKLKDGQVKLCTGCGAEIRRGGNNNESSSSTGIKTGADTLLPQQSKKQAKRARFVDVVESQANSNRKNSKSSSTATLCHRCVALQIDNNVYAAYDALRDVSPDVFGAQLSHVVRRRQFGLCLLVVDVTDEHSAMKHVRRYIGKKTPCWLILTKCDLMPRLSPRDISTLSYRMASLTEATFVQTLVVSATSGHGILHLAEQLLLNVRGRDVFCIGAANVGKSSLVQTLARTMAEADIYYKGNNMRHIQARRDVLSHKLNVTASHLPGTTLQAVRIPCFGSDKHALWDTPGILNAKSLSYSIFASHYMEPLSQPRPIPLPSVCNGTQGPLPLHYSLLIEAAWMDHPPNENRDDNGVVTATEMEEQQQQEEHNSCVLGRIDLVDIQHANDDGNGDMAIPVQRRNASPISTAIFVQAYVHPSLRIRIVPAHLAPSHATIPSHYIRRVDQLVQQANGANATTAASTTTSDTELSRPLLPYDSPASHMPHGRLTASAKERDTNNGRYYMDVVFASLGWIAVSHSTPFTVVPHVVQGSVFSKRRSLYPTNLVSLLLQQQQHQGGNDDSYTGSNSVTQMPHDEWSEMSTAEVQARLRDAARRGRHQEGQDPRQGGHRHGGYRGSGGGGKGSRRQRPDEVDFLDDTDMPSSVYAQKFNEDEWY